MTTTAHAQSLQLRAEAAERREKVLREALESVTKRERHRGTVFLDIEDLIEIDAALSHTGQQTQGERNHG